MGGQGSGKYSVSPGPCALRKPPSTKSHRQPSIHGPRDPATASSSSSTGGGRSWIGVESVGLDDLIARVWLRLRAARRFPGFPGCADSAG